MKPICLSMVMVSGLIAMWCFCPDRSQAAADAVTVQKSAILRIDGYIENFKKSGDMESQLPELAKAQEELMESNASFVGAGDHAAAALGYLKLGDVQRLQNRWDKALQFYREAEAFAIKSGNKTYEAKALMEQARTETIGTRNYRDAHSHIERAVQLSSSLDDKTDLFNALCYSAQMLAAEKNLSAAFQAVDRALSLKEKVDPKLLPYAYMDRADIYFQFGNRCDYEKTFDVCYEALDHAKADYSQARKSADEAGYKGLVVLMEGSLEEVEAKRELFQWKERSAKESDALLEKLQHPKTPADVLVTEIFSAGMVSSPELAKLLESGYSQGDAKARFFNISPEESRIYESARRIEEAAGGSAEGEDATRMFLRGNLYDMKNEKEKAMKSYLKAVALLERSRSKLHDPSNKGSFFEDKVHIYNHTILELLQRKRTAEAFDILERSRSRGMSDLIQGKSISLGSKLDQNLYGDLVKLDAEIARLQRDLVLAQGSGRGEQRVKARRSAGIADKVALLEAERDRLEERLKRDSPRLRELTLSQPASLDALQSSMKQDGYEILEYLVLETEVILWHISADATRVRNVFLPRAQLQTKVSDLLKSMNGKNKIFDDTTSRELFLFLVQPALQWIKTDRLVIIPHEELNHIPFQVLQNPENGSFLGDRFRITYAPSATLHMGLRRSDLSQGKVLVVIDKKIPESGDETQAIKNSYGDNFREVSTEYEVKKSAGSYDIIHFSVHGQFNGMDPLLSHLSLVKDEHDDGKLTASEMFGLPLERSKLVVLSACESGRVQSTHSNEVLGMERALLFAGAKSLILTLWKVDPPATALWMEVFYREAQTKPLAEAGRLALAAVKSDPRYTQPFYWGPFVMVGK